MAMKGAIHDVLISAAFYVFVCLFFAADAQAKVKSTGVPECASSGESDIYLLHRTVLKTAKGVELEVDGPKKVRPCHTYHWHHCNT